MIYDELSLVLEATHNGHRLQMLLDTGANNSFGYPSIRDALAGENVKLQAKRELAAGMGGKVKRRTNVIPSLRLDVAGRSIDISRVSVLPEFRRAMGATATECSAWMPCRAVLF